MGRVIGEHKLTQDLRVGDRVEVYDAHNFKEYSDGSIELGEIITTGLVMKVNYTQNTGNGLVLLDSLDKELIIGEYNFKLISEGNIDDVYISMSKELITQKEKELKTYLDLLQLLDEEVSILDNEISKKVSEYNKKVKQYMSLRNMYDIKKMERESLGYLEYGSLKTPSAKKTLDIVEDEYES